MTQYADGPIDLGDLEGGLAALRLSGDAQKEARRYLDAEPGWCEGRAK